MATDDAKDPPQQQRNGASGDDPEPKTAAAGAQDGAQEDATAGQEPSPEKAGGGRKGVLARLGLDPATMILMFKGSLPPIICIAIYQSTAISSLFPTLGYEIPIISVLALAVLPRGKYVQTLALNLLAVCVGSAVAVLVLWSSVQARINTSAPLTPAEARAAAAVGRPPYNSSQSAVCAVWLFSNIWIINVLRAKLPSFALPSIVYSILVNISATYGPIMATTAQAEAFVKQLMTSMLLALGISTAVSLLVFPMSSRTIVMGQFRGTISLLRRAVGLQRDYLRRLEQEDMFTPAEPVETSVGSIRRKPKANKAKAEEEPLTKESKAAQELEACITQLRELAGKLHAEITFAKRDAAWGKLSADDLGEIFSLLRSIFIPVMGLSCIMDIFRRAAENRGWLPTDNNSSDDLAEKEATRRVWNVLMRQLHEPFTILSEAIDQGLEHAGLQLELLPRPKAKSKASGSEGASEPDVEDRGGAVRPGEPGFARAIDEKVKMFYSTRSETLRLWARERGLMDGDNVGGAAGLSKQRKEHRQAQLYVLLYLEQLMHATGEAVQDLVAFADSKVEDGTMKKSRLQMATVHRLRKWCASIFSNEDSAAAESPDSLDMGVSVVYLGDGFGKKKDPEHLPATNAWERFGNGLRRIPAFFGSSESMFGLRCACATMTVGIICYIEESQVFFQEQRLVWAMIIIGMGMTQTAGQSIFGFLCRVGGSFLAMVFSLITWYIVDEKTPGVFVFLWLFLLVEYYFLVKYMRFISASMITIITQVLIIGYELQVRQIGIATAQRTGQPYYPTYELAPYRLATVTAGCAIAFFWTVFPVPLTDRRWLRRDLGATLYLLANYLSVVNESMKARLRPNMGSMDTPGTPAHQLLKVRRKLFSKLMLMLPSLQTHAQWEKFEPSVGGQFPRKAYDNIILRASRILNYLTLISYTVTWKPRDDEPDEQSGLWIQSLGEVVSQVEPTHNTILSTLTLLSNALLSGQSLPPHIPLPRPYELTRQLLDLTRKQQEKLDTDAMQITETVPRPADILDARNMEERGYAEFAVLQVCSTLIRDDIEGLVEAVSGLVGVVDFSFRVDISDSTLDTAEPAGSSKGGKED